VEVLKGSVIVRVEEGAVAAVEGKVGRGGEVVKKRERNEIAVHTS
jgi:hypothetical protein